MNGCQDAHKGGKSAISSASKRVLVEVQTREQSGVQQNRENGRRGEKKKRQMVVMDHAKHQVAGCQQENHVRPPTAKELHR